ncbi:baeRF7 domain-containing protein [Chroococcidiopsis sp.]|uniref:baeRF7 domain-containing protein n=1 Tax=Chroococcidiopsis sp. TaxID=3088168 RepID=UPI003F2EC44A
MCLLSIDEVKVLLEQRQNFCVSIFLPTVRTAGPEIEQEPIRLKNLLKLAQERLVELGMRHSKVLELLQPAQDLETSDFWLHQSDGLAIFCSPEVFRYYRLPLHLEELVVVSNHFHIKPLLPLLTSNGQFYILALSQKDVRLLQCTRDRDNQIDLTNVLPSLAEVLKFEQPERQIQSHLGTPGAASGRRGNRGGATIFHGHGAGDEDEKENLRLYCHRVDEAIQPLLHGDRAPLVLAGVEYLLPIYQEANTYPYLLDAAVTGNPEMLSAAELRQQAWALVQPYFLQEQQAAADRYRQLAGTGQISQDVREIVSAAYYQRIDCLFVAVGAQQWGTFVADTNTIDFHDGAEPGDEDLLDVAARHTLLNGGTVYAVELENLPDESPVAAIFRY